MPWRCKHCQAISSEANPNQCGSCGRTDNKNLWREWLAGEPEPPNQQAARSLSIQIYASPRSQVSPDVIVID